MEEAENDRCVFFRREPLLILAIYVDDGLVFAENQRGATDILEKMKSEFEIHEVTVATYLGFQIELLEHGHIFIHQSRYIRTILTRFEMEDCYAVKCPISTTISTGSAENLGPTIKFREAVGSLMYRAVTTRPDIIYAVTKVSRKVCNPTEEDWQAIKRIFRYLKGAISY